MRHSVSPVGINIIKSFEGLRLRPYRDSVKVPTIGYGSTFYENGRPVKMDDPPITEAVASAILAHVATTFAQGVDSLLGTLILTQNQFDALVCFTYNLGLGAFKGSTLLKKIRINPQDPAIRDEFMKWDKAGGKSLPGLTARRAAEANLYFKN